MVGRYRGHLDLQNSPMTPRAFEGRLVLVIEDNGDAREALALRVALLGARDVLQAADGLAGLEHLRRWHPDIVLCDLTMPVMDGLAATRRILEDGAARVVMLTTFDLDDYVYAALRAGASGFLLKHSTPDELANAVRVVAAGDALLAPSVTRRLVEDFADDVVKIAVTPGAREDHHAEVHGTVCSSFCRYPAMLTCPLESDKSRPSRAALKESAERSPTAAPRRSRRKTPR